MRFVVLGIGLLGLAVLAALWLTTTDRRGEARAVEVQRSDGEARHDREDRTVELATPSPLPVEPEAIASENAPTSQRTSPPDERATISGYVVFTGNLPPEEVTVVAEVFSGPVNERGNSRKLEVPVAPDGSFLLRLPASSRYALLDVEASCLHLSETVRAQPGEVGVVLEPEVFASIVGRVLPPLGLATSVESSRLADVKLVCTSKARGPVGGIMRRSSTVMRRQPDPDAIHATADGDGAFLIPMVPVGIELFVRVEHPFGPEQEVRLEPLAPAERRELVIALEPGMTISGRVVDENGLPVEAARVSAQPLGSRWGLSSEDPRSDPDGRFELTNLARQEWRVCARLDEIVQQAEVHVDGSSGDIRDLVITLTHGGCVEGTVEWPDGRPAKEFEVTVSGTGGFGFGSGEEGRFRICGLLDGVCSVEVTAEGEGVEGVAQAAEVRVGDTSLRLVLEAEPVFSVRGTVVDRAGQPVTTFFVSADSENDYECSTSQASGYFLVTGLRAGEWTVRVEASGYQSSEQRVLVGPRTEPLRFVLGPAGLIRGRVVDARGKPVAGASVGEEGRIGNTPWLDDDEARSDAEGRFEVAAPSALMRLQAVREGHAPSEPVEVEVEAGAIVEGVVLRLPESCRLVGRVLDAEGKPLPFAHVVVGTGRSFENTDADKHGEFAFLGLPEGEAEVWVQLQDSREFVKAEVLIAPGENSVELRFEKPDPVPLQGRIMRSGKSQACSLYLVGRGSFAEARTDAEGHFEVTLMHKGAWKGWIWLGEGMPDPTVGEMRRFDLTIPDVEAHEIALDLDTLPRISSFDEIDY